MQNKLKTLLSVSIVILVMIVFHYVGWLSSFENFLRFLIRPGSKAIYSLSVSLDDEVENFASLEELKNAYKELRKEKIDLMVSQVGFEILKEENEELRKQLNFLENNDYDYVNVRVVGKNIEQFGNTIIIDKGKKHGIKKNNPVVIRDGVLIGKVLKVEDSESIVRLINDNQSRVGATLMNQEKSMGLVEGGYGISIKLSFVPQNEMINIGEIVITSGLEDYMPYGLILGTVEAIEKEAYQPFQTAIVKSPVNLEKVNIASVLLLNEEKYEDF